MQVKIAVTEAVGWRDRLVGVIGDSDKLPLLISTRFGIHTFGLMFPIDAVVLDKTNRVRAIRERLTPWRVFFWNPRYDRVVELPAGFIAEHNLKPGTEMKLQ